MLDPVRLGAASRPRCGLGAPAQAPANGEGKTWEPESLLTTSLRLSPSIFRESSASFPFFVMVTVFATVRVDVDTLA
ncbi:MAG: hypothetical protein ACLQD9_05000 [Thermoplasmata archaeon]